MNDYNNKQKENKMAKMKTVKVLENDTGFYAKLGKRELRPTRGEAGKLGTWGSMDSLRRNVRKIMPTLGHSVGTFKYERVAA